MLANADSLTFPGDNSTKEDCPAVAVRDRAERLCPALGTTEVYSAGATSEAADARIYKLYRGI